MNNFRNKLLDIYLAIGYNMPVYRDKAENLRNTLCYLVRYLTNKSLLSFSKFINICKNTEVHRSLPRVLFSKIQLETSIMDFFDLERF